MMKVGSNVYVIKNDFIICGKITRIPLADSYSTMVWVKLKNQKYAEDFYAYDVFSTSEKADDELRSRLVVEHKLLLEEQQIGKQRINSIKRILGWSLGD